MSSDMDIINWNIIRKYSMGILSCIFIRKQSREYAILFAGFERKDIYSMKFRDSLS